MKHIHGGLAAFLFVFACVVLLHAIAFVVTTYKPDSPAATAFAGVVA